MHSNNWEPNLNIYTVGAVEDILATSLVGSGTSPRIRVVAFDRPRTVYIDLSQEQAEELVREVNEALLELAARLAKMDHWDEDPEYPVEDWRYEVANDDTRQSYKEWVASQKEAAE